MVQNGVTVVLPTYNEKENICVLSRKILETVKASVEVVVVDDDSPDLTWKAVEEMGLPSVRVIRRTNEKGLTSAIFRGIKESRYDIVVWMDADLSMPPEKINELLAGLEGHDIAIGSRALRESVLVRRQPVYREMMGRSFNLIIRAVGLSRFKDTQCGFKLLTARAAQDLFARARVDGFAFDVEILLLAQGLYRVDEVAVRWEHRDDSRVSLGLDSARMLLEVLTVRARQGWRSPARPGPRG